MESSQHDGLYPVTQNRKCGYIDATGKLIIKLEFDSCGDFSEGLAAVSLGKRIGFIDTQGKFEINPQFALVNIDDSKFSGGLAVVNVGFDREKEQPGKYGYINRAGKFIQDPAFVSAEPAKDGYVRVSDQAKPYLLRVRGNGLETPGFTSLPEGFEIEESFRDGLAKARRKNSPNDFAFIDTNNMLAFRGKYRQVNSFSEGFVSFQPLGEENVKCGYLDKKGKEVIPARFQICKEFSEGLAGVMLNGKWGFIDRTGEVVISPQFDGFGFFSERFSEGLAAVATGSKCGYIDKTGKFVINPQYDAGSSFVGGVARVSLIALEGATNQDRMKSGYINRSGKVIWAPSN